MSLVADVAEKPAGKPEKPGKENGQEAQPMSAARLAQVEAGLRAFHETSEEMSKLKGQLETARQDLKARDLELASLRERMDAMREDHSSVLNASESRATAAQAERDRAVSDMLALKTIVASMKRIFEMAPQ